MFKRNLKIFIFQYFTNQTLYFLIFTQYIIYFHSVINYTKKHLPILLNYKRHRPTARRAPRKTHADAAPAAATYPNRYTPNTAAQYDNTVRDRPGFDNIATLDCRISHEPSSRHRHYPKSPRPLRLSSSSRPNRSVSPSRSGRREPCIGFARRS